MARVDLRAAIEQQGDDHQRDHAEHGPGRTGVAAVEAASPLLLGGRVGEANHAKDAQRHEDRGREEVLDERQPVVLANQGMWKLRSKSDP